jgi:hypothetical protein
MSLDDAEKNSSEKMVRRKKDRAAEIADTFEWLITAFILAFVFRAFVMEAFRIPTGSMAGFDAVSVDINTSIILDQIFLGFQRTPYPAQGPAL